MQEILLNIAQLSPVIGILVYILYYFKNKVDTKEQELKELNEVLRNTEKENAKTLADVYKTLNEMLNDVESSSRDMTNELKTLKEWLKEKIK